jgi:putative SOS response-associated peptidase YedK
MTLTKRELAEIADELAAVFDPEDAESYRPRYNVAPTDLHFVLRTADGRRRLEPGHWGLTPTVPGRGPLINARAESAPFKEPFRSAYRGGRCVVPADGFYEWRTSPEGRQPLWFHGADGKLLLMAGLWVGGRFAVLTTAPNRLVREVHDRMPALLTPDEATAWLAAPSQQLLHPAAEGMLVAQEVSTRVNSVRNDDPECLAPAPPGPRQLSLV